MILVHCDDTLIAQNSQNKTCIITVNHNNQNFVWAFSVHVSQRQMNKSHYICMVGVVVFFNNYQSNRKLCLCVGRYMNICDQSYQRHIRKRRLVAEKSHNFGCGCFLAMVVLFITKIWIYHLLIYLCVCSNKKVMR